METKFKYPPSSKPNLIANPQKEEVSHAPVTNLIVAKNQLREKAPW